MFLSAVTKTSKVPFAARSRLPFFMDAQPASSRVALSTTIAAIAAAGTHQPKRASGRCLFAFQGSLCLLQHREGHFPADGGVSVEDFVKSHSVREILEKNCHGHPCANKNGSAPKHL